MFSDVIPVHFMFSSSADQRPDFILAHFQNLHMIGIIWNDPVFRNVIQ